MLKILTMKKILLTLIVSCLSLHSPLFAAAQKSNDKFKLAIPIAVAKTTGYKTVLLNLNDTERLTGKTLKQLIDGDEQATGYQKGQCILSLVFTHNKWLNSWDKHIYHSDFLFDHRILHETIYKVPGSCISDPCHMGEILKYVITIYAHKDGEKYIVAPTGDEYSVYVD